MYRNLIQNQERNDIMNKKSVTTILICLIISFILSYTFDFSKNKIISYDFVLNMEITLFSVSLAIVALMITILDKYKEKASSTRNWVKNSSSILTEISENTVLLLFIIIILIVISIFKSIIILIPIIDVMTVILLFSLLISLVSILDTTISVHKLVSNLRNILFSDDTNLLPSQTEIHLINAYRFLDESHKREFEELVKTITLKQQIDSQKEQPH